MIKIQIATNGKKIHDNFEEDNITFKEVALVVYRLEQIKQDLLAREFKNDVEVSEGYTDDDADERRK